MTTAPKNSDTVTIGSTIWVRDDNRRVYKKDPNGQTVGGPIFREHFVPFTVIGEDRNNWHIDTSFNQVIKVKKATMEQKQGGFTTQAYTEKGMEDAVWINDNRYKIIERMRALDADTLRTIAALMHEKGLTW